MEQATDAELIARSRDEPAAFAGVYERYATTIHRYAARRIGASDAETLMAETLMAETLMAETFRIAFEVLLTNKKATPSTGTIKWVPAGTSTVKTLLTVVKLAATGIIVKATQTITGGLFKGSITTTTISANLQKNGCTTVPLTTITFKNTTPLVTK